MNRCGSKLLEQWPTLGQLALHWAREAHSASAVRRWAANAATTTTSADRCPFRPVMTSDRKTASTSATATAVPLQCPFRMPPTQEQPTTFKEAETSTSGLAFDQMPSPTGLPLVGNLFDLIKAGGAEYLHRYCDMRHKTLGPIYREKLGNLEVVFISDANMAQKVYKYDGKYPKHLVPEPWAIYNQSKGIQRGLFFMDGEEWGKRRSALNKVFLKPKLISDHTAMFSQVVADMLSIWNQRLNRKSNPNDGLLIDHLEKDLYNWSIETLGTMLYGRRMGCVSETRTNLHEFVDCVQRIFVESTKMQLIPPKLAYSLRLPVWRRFEEAADKSLNLALQYVKENAERIGEGKGILKQLIEDGEIDLEEASRIIVDLFIAAADTTSHTTQWSLYLLSRHQDVQSRLYDQIQEVTQGEAVEGKHLPHLACVKNVLKESLRLYPVAPFLTRYLGEELNLGGYMVPKGQLACISLYTTGRMEEYFDSPDSFQPDRWSREKIANKEQVYNNYASLPFGIGVRSCIGRRVAEVQMQLLISNMIQQFYIQPATDTEIDIKLRMITTPEKPIDLILKRR